MLSKIKKWIKREMDKKKNRIILLIGGVVLITNTISNVSNLNFINEVFLGFGIISIIGVFYKEIECIQKKLNDK